MTREYRLTTRTAARVLKALFDSQSRGAPLEELAGRAGLRPETLSEALLDPWLTRRIRLQCVASVWAAVPAIIDALVAKSKEGSLPHARLLLDFTGFLHDIRTEVTSQAEEDEFEQFTDAELVAYIVGALEEASRSSPGPRAA